MLIENIFYIGIISFLISLGVTIFYVKGKKVSGISALLMFVLTIAITILFNGIYTDMIKVPRFYLSENIRWIFAIKALTLHAIYVSILLIIFAIIYSTSKRKGERYASLCVPYFVASIVVTIRWLYDACVLIIEKYHKIGVYAVLGVIIVVISGIIFYLQERKEKLEKLKKGEEIREIKEYK